MKAVMMAISPETALDILNGKTNALVAKRVPKLEPPYEMYLYCSHGKCLYEYEKKYGFIGDSKSNRIISSYPATLLNGKVIARVTVNKISYTTSYDITKNGVEIREKANISPEKLMEYAGGFGNKTQLFALHFSNLKIFEKPKEIGEFNKCDGFIDCFKCKKYPLSNNEGVNCKFRPLTKAPTNFCYIERELAR